MFGSSGVHIHVPVCMYMYMYSGRVTDSSMLI